MIHSLSLCAEVTLDLHNLNNEGREGNQQQTRMVHLVDSSGRRQIVNAISGDVFKHIYVRHLTPILCAAGQRLSPGAAVGNADRITTDGAFKEAAKGKTAAEIQTEMLTRCAVTDIAGTLFTEGTTVPRKSCVEFGWVTGLPEMTHTESYFHVKFEAERRKAPRDVSRGEGTMAGSQTIFHRPSSSGVYALICHLELARVGVNDVTREAAISEEERRQRRRSMVEALLLTLIKPAGAQTGTQNPHIVGCRGVIASSTCWLPAPTVGPLMDNYREQMRSITETLNKISPDAVSHRPFDTLADGVEILQEIAAGI